MSDVLPEIEILKECGPVYGTVQLLRSLPLSYGGMTQAMPNEEDLRHAFSEGHQRLAAGYEVLLHHYYKLRKTIIDMRENCKTDES